MDSRDRRTKFKTSLNYKIKFVGGQPGLHKNPVSKNQREKLILSLTLNKMLEFLFWFLILTVCTFSEASGSSQAWLSSSLRKVACSYCVTITTQLHEHAVSLVPHYIVGALQLWLCASWRFELRSSYLHSRSFSLSRFGDWVSPCSFDCPETM